MEVFLNKLAEQHSLVDSDSIKIWKKSVLNDLSLNIKNLSTLNKQAKPETLKDIETMFAALSNDLTEDFIAIFTSFLFSMQPFVYNEKYPNLSNINNDLEIDSPSIAIINSIYFDINQYGNDQKHNYLKHYLTYKQSKPNEDMNNVITIMIHTAFSVTMYLHSNMILYDDFNTDLVENTVQRLLAIIMLSNSRICSLCLDYIRSIVCTYSRLIIYNKLTSQATTYFETICKILYQNNENDIETGSSAHQYTFSDSIRNKLYSILVNVLFECMSLYDNQKNNTKKSTSTVTTAVSSTRDISRKQVRVLASDIMNQDFEVSLNQFITHYLLCLPRQIAIKLISEVLCFQDSKSKIRCIGVNLFFTSLQSSSCTTSLDDGLSLQLLETMSNTNNNTNTNTTNKNRSQTVINNSAQVTVNDHFNQDARYKADTIVDTNIITYLLDICMVDPASEVRLKVLHTIYSLWNNAITHQHIINPVLVDKKLVRVLLLKCRDQYTKCRHIAYNCLSVMGCDIIYKLLGPTHLISSTAYLWQVTNFKE